MTNTYIWTFVPIWTIDTDWSGWSITKCVSPQWLKKNKIMWHFWSWIIIGFVMWEIDLSMVSQIGQKFGIKPKSDTYGVNNSLFKWRSVASDCWCKMVYKVLGLG